MPMFIVYLCNFSDVIYNYEKMLVDIFENYIIKI